MQGNVNHNFAVAAAVECAALMFQRKSHPTKFYFIQLIGGNEFPTETRLKVYKSDATSSELKNKLSSWANKILMKAREGRNFQNIRHILYRLCFSVFREQKKTRIVQIDFCCAQPEIKKNSDWRLIQKSGSRRRSETHSCSNEPLAAKLGCLAL